MSLSLEQVFYGSGRSGYAILGASPGAKPFAARVEALCGSVGTPVGDYGGESFLLSIPEGDRVIMICGRRGEPDTIGRGTLFFHALIGLRKDLDAAKADAFTLFDQRAFAEQMPRGRIEALLLDAHLSAMRRHPLGDDIPLPLQRDGIRFPAAIRSTGVPDPNEVREFIGGKANELSWATFAFHPMEGFDLQVLPLRSSVPAHCNEYAGNMPMLSIGLVRHAGQPTVQGGGTGILPDRDEQGVRPRKTPQESQATVPPSAMLRLSLVTNAVLAVFCVVLLAKNHRNAKPAVPQGDLNPRVVTNIVAKKVEVPRQLTEEERKAIEKAAIDAVRRSIETNAVEAAREGIETAAVEAAQPRIKASAVEAYRKNLRDLLPENLDLTKLDGFKGVAAWRNEEDSEKHKSFEAFLALEKLLNIIQLNPPENTQ